MSKVQKKNGKRILGKAVGSFAVNDAAYKKYLKAEEAQLKEFKFQTEKRKARSRRRTQVPASTYKQFPTLGGGLGVVTLVSSDESTDGYSTELVNSGQRSGWLYAQSSESEESSSSSEDEDSGEEEEDSSSSSSEEDEAVVKVKVTIGGAPQFRDEDNKYDADGEQ